MKTEWPRESTGVGHTCTSCSLEHLSGLLAFAPALHLMLHFSGTHFFTLSYSWLAASWQLGPWPCCHVPSSLCATRTGHRRHAYMNTCAFNWMKPRAWIWKYWASQAFIGLALEGSMKGYPSQSLLCPVLGLPGRKSSKTLRLPWPPLSSLDHLVFSWPWPFENAVLFTRNTLPAYFLYLANSYTLFRT